MAINVNATRDISNGEILLSTSVGIDLATAPAEVTLYSVPVGQTVVVTKAVVRVTAASGVTGAAVAGIGTDASEENQLPPRTLTGLTAVNDDYLIFTETKQVVATAGQNVKFGIDTAISGGSMTVSVDLFGYVVGSVSALGSTNPKAHVTFTGPTAITTATWTPITWDTEVRDDEGFIDIGTNPDRLTASAGGDFLFYVQVGWADDINNSRLIRIERFNSGDVKQDELRHDARAPSSLGGHAIAMTFMYLSAAAGDYFKVGVYQDSGGNLNLVSALLVAARI